jgi:sporulation protein YlmC with PRC-barrel domain
MTVMLRKLADMEGVLPASRLIGEVVHNREEEKLGRIQELAIDPRSGRLAYALLALGGFMGIGRKFLAMPWKAFELSAPNGKLVLDVDKRKLETALIGTPRGRILLTASGVLTPPARAAATPVGNSGVVEEGAR